jgi:hypothetical protein
MSRFTHALARLIIVVAIGVPAGVYTTDAPRDTDRRLSPGPQATPAALSGPLRSHLSDERFDIVTAVRGLPLGVREGLQRLFESHTLDIADPDAAFSGSDVASPKLPSRRLSAAGCSADHHCLVYYERGTDHTWRVALFHWTPAETRFEWGGTAPGGVGTIEQVRRAIVSGAIKGPAASW